MATKLHNNYRNEEIKITDYIDHIIDYSLKCMCNANQLNNFACYFCECILSSKFL